MDENTKRPSQYNKIMKLKYQVFGYKINKIVIQKKEQTMKDKDIYTTSKDLIDNDNDKHYFISAYR